MVFPNLHGDVYVVDWAAPNHESVLGLLRDLANVDAFPEPRGKVVHLVGAIPEHDRRLVADGARALGAAVDLQPDAVALAASGGAAAVAWYATDEHLTEAETWATLMHRLTGARYVALGRVEDYERLEALGAVVPSIVSFGGAFAPASERPGWRRDGSGAAPASGFVRVLEGWQAIGHEIHRLNRLDRALSAGAGSPDTPFPFIDIAFYSPYAAQGVLGEDPLSFFSLAGLANPYAMALDAGGARIRPDMEPVALDFKEPVNGHFQNCNTTYQPSTFGWDCAFTGADETNHFEEAVRVRANLKLDGYRPYFTIRNVAIVSHPLDIPYRQKLFPYHPFSTCANCFAPAEPVLRDADHQRIDADNDALSCLQSYTFTAGTCTTPVNTRDGDQADDAYDNDTGSLDFFLADYYQDAGSTYKWAHAGYGRITGHTSFAASSFLDRLNLYLACRRSCTGPGPGCAICYPATGATLVRSAPALCLQYGLYDEWKTLLECRYGTGSPDVKVPCAEPGARCPNEVICTQYMPWTYSIAGTFMPAVKDHGQIVVAIGHNLSEHLDNQQVEFFPLEGDGICDPSTPLGDPDAVSSRGILDWVKAQPIGEKLQAGVWLLHASQATPHAFVFRHPCDPGQPCEGNCTSTCVNGSSTCGNIRNPCYRDGPPSFCETQYCVPADVTDPWETSFASTLLPNGAIALLGVHGGHTPPVSAGVRGDETLVLLKEVARGTPIGLAMRIQSNLNLIAYDASDPLAAYEIGTMHVGDPLISLPPPPGTCEDRPRFVAGRGDSPYDPEGHPQALCFRGDEIPLAGIVDAHPFGLPGSGAVYGSTLECGDFVPGDNVDELVFARGFCLSPPAPLCPTVDGTVKVTDAKGNQIPNGLFTAFAADAPGPVQKGGLSLAVGYGVDAVDPPEVFCGRPRESVFAPHVRGYRYAPTVGGGPNQFQAWAKVNFYAFPQGQGYGANVNAANFDATDSLDELLVTQGPGAAFTAWAKVYRALSGGGHSEGSHWKGFTGFSGAATYGGTVGSGDLDGDGDAEALLGKGVGDQVSGPMMDSKVEVWRYEGTAFANKLTIEPWVMVPPPYTLSAGARGVGVDLDGDGRDEVLVTRGPAQHDATGPGGSPEYFRTSHAKAYEVSTPPSFPWSIGNGGVPVFDKVLFLGEEDPPGPSTWGAHAAAMDSVPLGYRPQTIMGQTEPESPWTSGAEMGRGLVLFVGQLPEAYFRSAGSKAELAGSLRAALGDLAAGNTAGARARLADAKAALGSLVEAETTLMLLSDELARMERSILQQEANRPPVARVHGEDSYARTIDVAPGETVPVYLHARGSSDPDSTAGTADNIVAYRWLGAGGRLLAEGMEAAIPLSHEGPRGTEATHELTLQVVDAYGAAGTAPVHVVLRGVRP